MAIHPTAVVAPGAEVHPSCEVGPFAVIGPSVKLGPDNRIGAHAVLEGDTTLGAGNRVFPHAVLGQIPQDLKYAGEPTRLVIGDRNQFREFTTVHLGTAGGGGVTRVGSGCLLMANAHVAHDCQVGDGCILANSVALGGHVVAEDHVIFGGLSGVHQFVRLGRYAFLAAGSVVVMDVPPYCTVQGDRATLAGLNTVGLARAGFDDAQNGRVRAAYRKLFRGKLRLEEAVAELRAEMGREPEIAHLLSFLEGSQRGVTR
ncbi:MAG TPA: acyl-ACP--UDP-N-acetylglucosamine O-acyltransferase [Anaeromyxobacteraceae bacterium]|jgi:UDP-N-acetylglucosamine acyltransferase|nr:acyl-ACP--UDP-N-acetylglucosamine O-acyltransferase [Anaeromyxobacteraceae bacterium]